MERLFGLMRSAEERNNPHLEDKAWSRDIDARQPHLPPAPTGNMRIDLQCGVGVSYCDGCKDSGIFPAVSATPQLDCSP
jgi:hypothetical protein